MSLLDAFTTLELLTMSVAGLTALVGLYIGYQAYRGLRRHDSAPMRYLSIGMVLLFGVTYVTAFAGNALLRVGPLPLVYQDYFRLVVRLVQLSGVLCIAYSLYLTRADESDAPRATGADD